MRYLRDGKPVFENRRQFPPGGPPLATLCQRMEPAPGDLSPELLQHRDIAGNRVVLVVAIEYAPQPFPGPSLFVDVTKMIRN